ncbi:MAG: HlyD family efflux transporter periplasmic adaptor subunit [Candidatus Zixiibacteriota bacterium]|nr:MAG: HlyD family efflux transporter periplasmic adaptor subunit [candidate division Zixibacteria bacterium]
MDRALPQSVVRNVRLKRAGIIAAVLLVLAGSAFVLRMVITPTLNRDRFITATAELGSVEATVSASGVIVPEFEEIITSPVKSTVETVLVSSGDSVGAGQTIMCLNKDLLNLTYQQLNDELEIQKNKKAQLGLELQRRQIELQSSYEIKELQTRFIESQTERVKHLFELGSATGEDLDRALLNLDIAKRELEQLDGQIANQEKTLEADLKGLDLQISIQTNRVNEVLRDLELADARAAHDGIVTWVNDNIGSPINPGDVLARVADLSSFRVEARISDIHADKLLVGGAVKVRIGRKDLAGKISSIRPSVEEGVVTFMVALEHKSDRSLRPNLRSDVHVVTSSHDNVVRVENGNFYYGSVDQEVFVVEGDRAHRKIVNIGASNFDYVELQGDIKPGDEVIISDMRDYRHMEVIEIKP